MSACSVIPKNKKKHCSTPSYTSVKTDLTNNPFKVTETVMLYLFCSENSDQKKIK